MKLFRLHQPRPSVYIHSGSTQDTPQPRNATRSIMGSLIQGLRRLYSLDTLDTRLTTSSTTPIKTAISDSTRDPTAGKDARAQEIASRAQPSKWNTPEFYFYYFVFITVVPMMFKTVIDVSQPDHPAYKNYVDLLSPGWVPGRKVVRPSFLFECYTC